MLDKMKNCKKEIKKIKNDQRMNFVNNIKKAVNINKLVTTRDMAWIIGELNDEEKEWIMELAKFAEVPF